MKAKVKSNMETGKENENKKKKSIIHQGKEVKQFCDAGSINEIFYGL